MMMFGVSKMYSAFSRNSFIEESAQVNNDPRHVTRVGPVFEDEHGRILRGSTGPDVPRSCSHKRRSFACVKFSRSCSCVPSDAKFGLRKEYYEAESWNG